MPRKSGIGIVGTGRFLPTKVLNNADLEKMVDTSDEWIMTRTGIKERRIAGEGIAAAFMGAEAAKRALQNAGLDAGEIDLIITATITPDMQFPSTSCLIQHRLGAVRAIGFDISAACSGYIYGITIAQQFIKSGLYRNALVIGSEKMSSITDWEDRNTCVLFGDGAGACVMQKVKEGGILSTYLGSDGRNAPLLEVPGGGSLRPASHETIDERLHYCKMSGSELFKEAVKLMAEAGNKAMAKSGLKCGDIDLVIPHQANIRILWAVAKKMNLPREKIYLNIERYGNMSSASTAVALAEAVEEKRIKKGDIIILDAFGAGLTWGAIVIKW
ncbi:MAG: ketoacyl-ACP synthase III [Candidatus Omnitrophica bacterium]|nr:ketoacyl-ACP synthase III [Candidatus Omnitrophota bacterium]